MAQNTAGKFRRSTYDLLSDEPGFPKLHYHRHLGDPRAYERKILKSVSRRAHEDIHGDPIVFFVAFGVMMLYQHTGIFVTNKFCLRGIVERFTKTECPSAHTRLIPALLRRYRSILYQIHPPLTIVGHSARNILIRREFLRWNHLQWGYATITANSRQIGV